jgi:alpha-galactosidase
MPFWGMMPLKENLKSFRNNVFITNPNFIIMRFEFVIISFLSFIVFSCREVKPENQPQKALTNVAVTPPMGWNSYNCFGAAVLESEVRANADFMARNLKKYGWEYIVIDYCWYYPHPPNSIQENPPQFNLPQDGAPVPWMPMDEYCRLLPDPRKFPSAADGKGFKPLADYIHSLGLKFGIHLMRGIARQAVWADSKIKGAGGISASMIADTNSICTWLNLMYGVDMTKKGAQEYYNSLFELYASWDVDFVKVDNINAGEGDAPFRVLEAEAYRKAIDNCGRPMVLSFSSGLSFKNAEQLRKNGNMWRISNDFWDTWSQLKEQFPLCAQWAPVSGPKSWPDADMLPIGNLRLRGPFGKPGRSLFTVDEQYTMMTLWSIFRSPFMIGGNLPDADDLMMKLLTNDEVLKVDQQSVNNRQLFRDGDKIAWIADIPGSREKYIALFYTGDLSSSEIKVNLSDIGFTGQCKFRNLWTHKEEGTFSTVFSTTLAAHASGLFRVSPM